MQNSKLRAGAALALGAAGFFLYLIGARRIDEGVAPGESEGGARPSQNGDEPSDEARRHQSSDPLRRI